MSHFSVLVIGNDVQAQLAPYDENRPDGDDGYNSRARWDWWLVGGRWRGSVLRVKPGATSGVLTRGDVYPWGCSLLDDETLLPSYVDSCTAGDVDWDAIRADRDARARDVWHRFHAVAGDLRFTSFDTVVARHGGSEGVAAAAADRGQPLVVALRASQDPELRVLDSEGIAALMSDEASYAEREARQALTFAVARDGEWYERGEMGWFGTAMHEKARDVWAEEFAELVRDVDPGTMLTVVDCHI
jgi:hypothetical protein